MSNATPGNVGRLEDKVAVVTGGSGGIGRAVCRALLAEGASLVMVDRAGQGFEDFKKELEELPGAAGRCLALALDATSEDDMEAMASQAVERFGRIELLVTCAGILRAPGSLPKPMAKLSLAEWNAVIDVNLKGVFLSNRAVLPAMISQREGSIVNLSSTSGRQGRANDAPYCASKFGVVGLSESLAEEVRAYGIKVQAILPDAVDTPLWDQNGPIKPEHALAPERVADLIVYMAALPADTLLVAPVIAPFRTRKRKGKGGGKGSMGKSAAAAAKSTEEG